MDETASFVRAASDSVHPWVDRDALSRVLGSATLPETPRGRVMGPVDLHVLERYRARLGFATEDAAAADYFVWGTGEPANPALTKLGGVPFLPADLPWPEREGTTADFYGQLNFQDSKDLVPALPGDVLLVFRFHDLDYSSWDDELYQMLWVDAAATDIVRSDRVRTSRNGARDPWPAMHAYRVRSCDFPGATDLVRDSDDIEGHPHNAPATKIGGLATDMQSIWEPDVPDDWRFLGQLTGLWPAVDQPYPVVDRAAPFVDGDSEYHAFCTGPGDGITCFYLDGKGDVQMSFSCA